MQSSILIQANSGYYSFEGATKSEFRSDTARWDIIPLGTDNSHYYRFQKQNTNFFLCAAGERLILKEITENDQEDPSLSLWKVEPVHDKKDYHFIISVKNKKAVTDVEGNSHIMILFDYHGGSNQQWKFIDPSIIIERSPQQRFYNSLYNYLSKHSGEKYNFGDLFNALIHHGDVFTRILCQLSMKELAQFRSVCKQISQLLPVYWVYKKEQTNMSGDYNDIDKILFKAPSVTNHILRIKIHLKWSDQGWGNLKTRMMFYLKRYGQIIAKLEFNAIHTVTEEYLILEDHEIVSKAQTGDEIEVWRHVGGGGGHILKLLFLRCVFEYLK